MCQSVPAGYGAPTLPPHQYPVGIKVFAGVVAVVALYGLFSTPHALMSLHQLRAADALYDGGNFPGAAQAYEGVLKEAPRSGTAKLGAAKAYFHFHDESADRKALSLSGRHGTGQIRRRRPGESDARKILGSVYRRQPQRQCCPAVR